MPTPYKINGYLKCVSDQIRWNAAKEPVCLELEEHILDQRDAFMQEGDSEDVAIDKAIEEMGDPFIVGGQLDSTHRPSPNMPVLILTGVLFSLGMLLRFFSRDIIIPTSSSILGPIIAIFAFVCAYLLDFTIFQKRPKWLMIGVLASAVILILLYPLFPLREVGGKLLSMYSISLFFPLALAYLIYSQRSKGYKGAGICFGACVILMLLSTKYHSITSILMLLPPMSGLIIYAAAKDWFDVGKGKGKWILIGGTMLLIITSLILLFGFTQNKIIIETLMNPEAYKQTYLFANFEVREMLSNAKFINTGIVNPASMWQHHEIFINTYFLTHIIYQYGWLAFVGIMAVFSAFVGVGFYYCAKQKNFLGKLVSYAIMATITMQAVLYVLDNLGIGISTSAVMPLISPGNSLIVLNMLLIGFMLSVFKTSHLLSSFSMRKEKAVKETE